LEPGFSAAKQAGGDMLSASLTGSAGLTTDQRGVIIVANAEGVLLCRFPELIWEMSEKRVSLSISRETKVMLDSVKHTGQSYNGLLQELVTLRKKQKGTEVKSGGQAGEE